MSIAELELQIRVIDSILAEIRSNRSFDYPMKNWPDWAKESIAESRRLRTSGLKADTIKLKELEKFMRVARRSCVKLRLVELKKMGITPERWRLLTQPPVNIDPSTNEEAPRVRQDICVHGIISDRCPQCDPDGYIYHYGDWEDD